MQESNLFQLQPNLPSIDERFYYIHQQLMNVFNIFTITIFTIKSYLNARITALIIEKRSQGVGFTREGKRVAFTHAENLSKAHRH